MHKIKIVSNAHIKGNPSRAYTDAVKKIDRIEKMLSEEKKAKKERARVCAGIYSWL